MAGRPKMTEAQKEAAKAEREAAKTAAAAGAKGKADKAEARSGAAKPSAAAAKPQTTGNTDDLDREEKALFLHHMPLIKAARDRVASATGDLRNLYKKAKAEGNFTKADFDTAFALETAEKEAKARARIARELKIARIVGSSMGNQLDLFLEPDRTPAADNAFAEGERDAMQNLPAKLKYDPSTEQARKYLEGYHSVSAKRVKEGIGKLDPEDGTMADQDAKAKAKSDQQKAQDAKAFEQSDKPNGEGDKPAPETGNAEPPAAPASGTPMTRAQFKAEQEKKKAAETQH